MFPLGAVLLPGQPLPLQVFEPRYLTMLRDVAAGDGALRTAVTGPIRSMTKSSPSDPARPTAWARTPAPPGTRSASARLGT